MSLTIHEKLLQRTTSRPNAYFAGGLAAYITIHMTGNRSAGADAHSHAMWHFTSAPYSWHYTVDDTEAWQQLREDEQGWHAGDGSGDGNVKSIGIEVCMNAGIDQERAYANAVELVRGLIARGHGAAGVVQHNFWTGKDCPELIRAEDGRWLRFIEDVYKAEEEPEMTDDEFNERFQKAMGTLFPNYLRLAFEDVPGKFSDRPDLPMSFPYKPWQEPRVITIPGVTRE